MKSRFLVGLLMMAAATTGVIGQANADGKLTAVGHKVHQRSLVEGDGGNIAGEWATKNHMSVEWMTFNVQEVHERLFRESSLSETAIDVGFALSRYYRPQMANMFEPLDDYLKAQPIEAFDEFPKGMLEGLTFNGKLYGIPFRHATSALHYNEEYFKERGISEPPKTFEDVVEYAKKLTFVRPDGTRVHGFAMDYRGPGFVADVARPFGGDFLSGDMKLHNEEPGMLKAVGILQDFFQTGVLPKTFLNFTNEDTISFMQQGRLAMAITVFSRYLQFNDPEKSKFPGKFKVIPIPPSKD